MDFRTGHGDTCKADSTCAPMNSHNGKAKNCKHCEHCLSHKRRGWGGPPPPTSTTPILLA
eukprot:1150870-Pelagomonas_calceolata.AAC.10